MKKGQGVSQNFVYIIAIVVVGVILIFGYKVISDVTKNTGKAGLVRFQSSLESSISSISNQYGTVKTKEFPISGYKKVCFMDNYNFGYLPVELDNYPLIKDTIEDGQPTLNVFMVDLNNQMEQGFNIGVTEVAGDFKCIDIKDNILKVVFEGKGNRVLIS